MYNRLRIGVVVPAFNEAMHLEHVLEGMPACVDHIVVINDGSTDHSSKKLSQIRERNQKLHVIHHASNQGVGACILEGYQNLFNEHRVDVAVVMAGDGQMDPADLPTLLEPLVSASVTPEAMYIKGNRFLLNARTEMPVLRQWGVAAFSWATRVGLGLDVNDTQCGYTAITAHAFKSICWKDAWKTYGYPNDILGRCKRHNVPVIEVPVHARYRGEQSGLTLKHVLISVPKTICIHTANRHISNIKKELNMARAT